MTHPSPCLSGPVPVVIRVSGHAAQVAAGTFAALFLALLMRVVALLAQRLPVLTIPEQATVTTVGLDVVNHIAGNDSPQLSVHHTQRMLSKP